MRQVRPRARLLDLVPGRSGRAYAEWLNSRGEAFTSGIQVATLDPSAATATRSATSWRAVNAPRLVALVRAGARFEKGVLVE